MNKISSERIQMKKHLYKKYQDYFNKKGFTYTIACELIPVTQLRVWDMFGLFCCAKGIPDGGTYLEIGSKWGGSLRCVLRASQAMHRKIKLIAIEPKPNGQLLRFCKDSGTRLIKGYSQNEAGKIAGSSVDMLFIDGPHNYGQVSKDLAYYWPKVKLGGLVAGHDHEKRFPGVAKAVREFLGNHYNVLKHSTIYISRKDGDN